MKFINQRSYLLKGLALTLMTAWMIPAALSQKVEIEHNSTVPSPQLLLKETDNDFSRIKMQNTTNPTKYWDLAGRSHASDAFALFNFYYFNGAFGVDHMTITGAGRVGIGTTSPDAKLEVNGYTLLGAESDSPAIKTKKIEGTTPGAGSVTRLPHGLGDHTRILAVHLMILDNLDGVFFYNHRDTIWHDDTEVASAVNLGNNRTYRMFIIYQE